MTGSAGAFTAVKPDVDADDFSGDAAAGRAAAPVFGSVAPAAAVAGFGVTPAGLGVAAAGFGAFGLGTAAGLAAPTAGLGTADGAGGLTAAADGAAGFGGAGARDGAETGAEGAIDGVDCGNIERRATSASVIEASFTTGMTAPHLRHFIFIERPVTFSSAI